MGIENRINKIEEQLDRAINNPACLMVVIRPQGNLMKMTTHTGGRWFIRPGETSDEFYRRATAEAEAGADRALIVCTFTQADSTTKEIAQ